MIGAAFGGVLIGLAACWLLLSVGRIAGVSGITARALTRPGNSAWALVFVAGMGIGGTAGLAVVDVEIMRGQVADAALYIFGGLLVGFGTRLGSGCTSGHGVCGIGRVSISSIAATLVFLSVGMFTATWLYAS